MVTHSSVQTSIITMGSCSLRPRGERCAQPLKDEGSFVGKPKKNPNQTLEQQQRLQFTSEHVNLSSEKNALQCVQTCMLYSSLFLLPVVLSSEETGLKTFHSDSTSCGKQG